MIRLIHVASGAVCMLALLAGCQKQPSTKSGRGQEEGTVTATRQITLQIAGMT